MVQSKQFWNILSGVVIILLLVSQYVIWDQRNNWRESVHKWEDISDGWKDLALRGAVECVNKCTNVRTICEDPMYMRLYKELDLNLSEEVDWESMRINQCRHGATWACEVR